MLIEYYLRCDEISYARDLAHAQLSLDPKEGIKRFVDFQHIQFPWLKEAAKREQQKAKDALESWVKSGALTVSRSADDVRRHHQAVSHLRKNKPDVSRKR